MFSTISGCHHRPHGRTCNARTHAKANKPTLASVRGKSTRVSHPWMEISKMLFQKKMVARVTVLTRKITVHAKCSMYLPYAFFHGRDMNGKAQAIFGQRVCSVRSARGEHLEAPVLWSDSAGATRAAHVSAPLHAQMNPLGRSGRRSCMT